MLFEGIFCLWNIVQAKQAMQGLSIVDFEDVLSNRQVMASHEAPTRTC